MCVSVSSFAPVAQKEEADFQKYRESLKLVTIDEPPELLGKMTSYMWEGVK